MQSLRWKSLILLASAFGVVEAGLVTVYRSLLDPQGTEFPLLEFPARLLWVEQVREVATLLLLGAAARLLTARRSAAFAGFLLAFGLWDLVYYAGLRGFLGWPRHLGDWDLLFLVPVPWLAPVWAPMLVALVMVTAGGLALHHESRRGTFQVGPVHVAAACAGGALCIGSFVHGGATGSLEEIPEPFALELLLTGLALGTAAFAHAWRRNRRGPVAARRGR